MRQSEAKPLQCCTICNEEKELSEFISDKNQASGYRSQCKQCRREQQKDWRKEDRNGFVALANERMRRYRSTEKGAIYQRLVSAKGRAKQEGYESDLDIDYLRDLFKKQGEKCALSGEPLDFKLENRWNRPSLDKIIPEKGYMKGNVQFLTMQVNVMKNNLPEEKLIELCKKIVKESSETIRKE